MPFKAISTPKKIMSVDAEIRGATYLSKEGLVAMLSHEPVRLASIPSSGSNGKITNISIDGAEAVALLSRDVAVVRASDDSVWALLDITHTPKMDQVCRDIRQLAARPGGDTALAIGWDGTAHELKLNKHEVDARQFALRGTIRACNIGETECYVVIDGAGGGQVRVHPGSTPEPAASLRCDLPDGAASLDHVRGCPRLIAVYKPGSRKVCVATGGPIRLASKMVELESEVRALGVCETSFVAMFSDGRAALYDAEAIASASDGGAITPTSSMQFGGKGEPTAMTIMQKNNGVWVGTRGGDVLNATLLKKGLAIGV